MTLPDCSSLRNSVSAVSLVQGCDVIRSGALRLLTPFQYPNGSQIDLFLESPEPLLATKILSDLGQTTGYLLDVQVRPWATNKRRQIIEDVCASLGVVWRGGRLQIELQESDLKDISIPMLRLSQACIRISDLAFSARLWSSGSFKDEFEEFLQDADLQYEADVREPARGSDDVKIDFRIHGETTVSLVLSLSAASSVSAHTAANEAFSRWFDLGKTKPGMQHLTIVDESHDVYRDTDLRRLERLSTVLAFPTEQERIREAIAA